PVKTNLLYDPQSKFQQGTFKVTHFGTISPPLPAFGSTGYVAIKRAFVRDRAMASPHPMFYDAAKQAELLSVEVNCAQWAAGLMQLCYAFIQREDVIRGPPPFTIPQLQFVCVGLAVEDASDINDQNPSRRRQVFLLEQYIDSTAEGRWRKYINNDTPTPLAMIDEDDQHRADFLAFCQHIQFLKTKRLLFVSDFQGKYYIL
ncbi:uncharacterized protein LAESUDRAFT_645705, partial [Laetiporus sulphureus 93-53]